MGIFLFILFTFLVNTFHTQFPDEFDNIYGGFLINHGKLPYIGFFTHHNPGAYFLASLITLFTGRSFVAFRIVFAFLLFTSYVLSYLMLKRRLKGKSTDSFLLFGILIGLGATYWWGQMLLSETIVGFLLVPALLLVIGKVYNQIKFDLLDLWIVSLLTFFSLFTSLTYIYLIPIFDFLVIYFYLRDKRPFRINKVIKPILIFFLPYFIFLTYLIITKSASEFYFASIYYNVAYYIYNFPKVAGVHSHHPIRYAISIAKNTIENFSALLVQVSNFNFSYPLNISLALANVAFLIFLLFKRKFALVFLIISIILYTNARSEPLNIKETDFHATVFIMLTLAITSYLFFRLKEDLDKRIPYFERLVMSSVFIITAIYWFFTTLHLFNKFLDKSYGKLMGNDPLIYDRPQAAPIINKIITEDDYFWIGPFELQELLFIKGKIASKYYWFLPANARDERLKREIIADLNKNRPKVILFKRRWATFGVKPEDFNTVIVDFLGKHYFQIEDLKKEGLGIRLTVAPERDFDFEKELFFDKNRKEGIIKELFEKGLIEKINI